MSVSSEEHSMPHQTVTIEMTEEVREDEAQVGEAW